MLIQENWVLCRIFLKKRSGKSENEMTESLNCTSTQGKTGVVFYDFMAKDRSDLNLAPPVSSSSGCSGITEISFNESDEHEEESSSCNTSCPFKRKQP